jgi:protease PrsW
MLDFTTNDFAIAFLIGLIPALFWLWFWLREDRAKPEPLLLITIAFVAGMAVVPLTLPLQSAAISIYHGNNLMWVWVVIEEVLKYAAALFVVLWNREVDEPIDFVVYLIAIALGFAALENALFLLTPLMNSEIATLAVTGSFRFLGATLLHVLCSATIGMALALAFYKSRLWRVIYGTVGLFIAILLHGWFNFFIMRAAEPGRENELLIVFLFVWMGIIVLFLLFEKIKLLESLHKPLIRK